jgi:ribosome biogenesis protein UTP30
MPPKFVLENIQAVVENAVPKIPRKWSNIRSISIKTPTSMSLPFYNKTLDELKQISKMAGLEEETKPQLNEEVVKAEKETKRKLAAKSPLVQALKKMDNDVPDESKKTKKKTAKKAESESGTSTEATNESAKKKRKVTAEADDMEPKVSKNDAKKAYGKKMGKDVPPQESEETKRKVGNTAESESGKSKKLTAASVKKQKRTMSTEVNDEEPRDSMKETNKSKVQDDFIASKKYKGSKEGFVFRSSEQGLGYYVDVKPVVDRMAMEAFRRLGASQSRGGGRKWSKSPGRRGRR